MLEAGLCDADCLPPSPFLSFQSTFLFRHGTWVLVGELSQTGVQAPTPCKGQAHFWGRPPLQKAPRMGTPVFLVAFDVFSDFNE